MKFLSITETESKDKETLQADYAQAHEIGKVHLGKETLFVKKGFKVYYISFSEIYRAFRRVKCVPVHINRKNNEIRLEYVVLCNNKEELCEIDLPNEQASTSIIEELSQKAPKIKIGKKD